MIHLIIAIIFFGCNSSILDDGDTSLPKELWRVPLGPDPSDQKAQDPYIYQNKLIMGYQRSSLNTEGYYVYDKSTGKVLKDIPDIPSFDPNSMGIGNLYISLVGSRVRTIDLSVGYNVLSRQFIGGYISPANLVDDNKYFVTYDGRGENRFSSELMFTDLISKSSPISYIKREMLHEEGVFGTSMAGFTVDKATNNDKILYFGVLKFFSNSNTLSKYVIEAFNMSTNQTIWKTDEFSMEGEKFGKVGWAKFDIYKDLYITGVGNNTLCAFDKHTGKIVWKTKLKIGGRSVMLNGKITVITNVGDMYLINADTGEILKERNIGYVELYNISLHKGIMYFATVVNSIMAIDADTHKTKWNISPPRKCSFCSFGYAYTIVDPETDRLYVSDKHDVICYQLPK